MRLSDVVHPFGIRPGLRDQEFGVLLLVRGIVFRERQGSADGCFRVPFHPMLNERRLSGEIESREHRSPGDQLGVLGHMIVDLGHQEAEVGLDAEEISHQVVLQLGLDHKGESPFFEDGPLLGADGVDTFSRFLVSLAIWHCSHTSLSSLAVTSREALPKEGEAAQRYSQPLRHYPRV